VSHASRHDAVVRRLSTPSRRRTRLAAGGIGSGRQMAAAALGAQVLDRIDLAHRRRSRHRKEALENISPPTPAAPCDHGDTASRRVARTAWTDAWRPRAPKTLPMPLQGSCGEMAAVAARTPRALGFPSARSSADEQRRPTHEVIFEIVEMIATTERLRRFGRSDG